MFAGTVSVPPMPTASTISTLAFLSIVIAVAVAFVLGVRVSTLRLDHDPQRANRHALSATLAVVFYALLTAVVAGSGLLEREGPVPLLMPFIAACNLLAVGLAFSRLGTRLSTALSIAALVGFQAFRLPLELVLHRWYGEGVIPAQMTFEGHNFDILSGIGAIVLFFALRHGAAGWRSILAYNLMGTGLLITVATIAVLSSPVPFRAYPGEPTLVLAYNPPYTWILPFCVSGALFGHLLVFRWLWANRGAAAA